MKPTQQEIIDVAREAGIVFDERAMPYYERLVHLALERFGAGGGEPVAFVHWPLSGAPRLVWYGYKALNAAILKAYEGHQPDMLLYTHPSSTDLRDAYYEGFMASGEGWNGEYPFQDGSKDPRLNGRWCQTRDNAIRALKGKQ